jgi:ABC-type glycerol-3-phosphate transport system substrate-binding protein
MPNGPSTWQELLEGGAEIKASQGIQMGIGMSNEIDSNMAARAIIWSFGGKEQDENENVAINSEETIAAVAYMKELYEKAMTPEVFSGRRPPTTSFDCRRGFLISTRFRPIARPEVTGHCRTSFSPCWRPQR